ncbi:hypothetical protein FRC06_008823, partial [Ceratobasidium sp. 370]
MHSLANTYYQQGQYDKAEALQVQTLEGRREALGEQHPDTLSASNALLTTYDKLGTSRQHERRALQGRTRDLQPVVLEIRPVRSSPWIKIVMLLLIVSPVALVFLMAPPPPP